MIRSSAVVPCPAVPKRQRNEQLPAHWEWPLRITNEPLFWTTSGGQQIRFAGSFFFFFFLGGGGVGSVENTEPSSQRRYVF